MLIVPSFVERLFRVLIAGRGGPETQREDPRHLLHGVLQRVARLPGPLGGRRSAGAGGLLSTAGLGGEPRAMAARLPGRPARRRARDARGWYASARSHAPDGRYRDLTGALEEWSQGAAEIIRAKGEAPDRVFVVIYERLVTEPEPVTRALAESLEMDWVPALLEPDPSTGEPCRPTRASRSRPAAFARSRWSAGGTELDERGTLADRERDQLDRLRGSLRGSPTPPDSGFARGACVEAVVEPLAEPGRPLADEVAQLGVVIVGVGTVVARPLRAGVCESPPRAPAEDRRAFADTGSAACGASARTAAP